jgi:hypothetical protein
MAAQRSGHNTSHHFKRVRVGAAAEFLAIKRRSLANPAFRKKHNIPTLRIGRAVLFDLEELDRWLIEQRNSSKAE